MDRIPLEDISDPRQLTQEFDRYRREGNLDPLDLTEDEENQALDLMLSPSATRLRPPYLVDIESLLPYGRTPAESFEEYLIRKQALNDAFGQLAINHQNIVERWNTVWSHLTRQPLGPSAKNRVALYVAYRQYNRLKESDKNRRDMITLKEDFVRVNPEWARLELTRGVPPVAERAFEYIY
jgi:hypothetical protein